ncbi:MAG: putative O-glycosylation ligase, exosortase A system-associated [Burkholderiaceae bacterium]|nr:putative O-glycosylation ligase, exosortase A system-associated [Burkholderiaceae bacterium]
MRDIVIVAIVVICALTALRRPWVGVVLWTWLSLMNPHRFTYGFAFDAPLAAMAAGSTLVGFVLTKDKSSPVKGTPVVWMLIFMVWFTLSWLAGMNVAGDYEQWNKVMKIDVMIIVGMALLHSKLHIMTLCWVCVGSLALLGAKGGLFTIATGGSYRVWGPPGSFIADNNEFALSLVMTIPLLRFLQLQLREGWPRHAMTVVMLLCAASALGSQSRGALLAISAMALVLWWRGNKRLVGGVLMLLAGAALVAFMPDSWSDRMSTIQEYSEDRSAMGRISAWWVAWGIGKTHLLGVGFDPARPDLFAIHSPYPDYVHAAHSIYFQVMGNHGMIGFFIFLGIFVSTFIWAGRLRKEGLVHERAKWCGELGAMAQVSLVGYAVGGAFLSLAYFDLPYNIMMMVVLARVWTRQRAWEKEPQNIAPDHFLFRWLAPRRAGSP